MSTPTERAQTCLDALYHAQQLLPDPPWTYTDDTAQPWVLTRHLMARGDVDQSALAM